MFWGLIMEPNKRYTQTVEKSFHVSMASLDAVTADNTIVQVMLCYDERNYLLCSLKKDLAWQVPLDLNFQEGTKIAFTSNGRGHVHLTGYLIPEEEDDLDLDEMEEEDEEEEDDEEVPQLVGKQSKRKANESPKENKKIKRLKAQKKEEESSEEDDDDVENDDEEDEEGLEVKGEAEEDSDEMDDDDDEEEEDDSEEDDEEEPEVKPQQKKNKQQQKQNAKQEKQKMVNGKDVKQESQKQQKKNKAEQQQPQQNNAQVQKKRVIEGGVQIEDIKIGNGAPAKPGKFAFVYYVGKLKNGKKFDSIQYGDGFKFRLGKGEVIKGWDVGIAGMKIGGKRKITIPPHYAYGAKGSPPAIPGNSTLVFDVELKNVH
ncbi:46 kDa FK506-binding nuclear protein [Venturia canescens]|uniref:46 kDa FK506-binding nuclear protein n=1 Tax=Venturia canescens TaxID=32260 RepID=UPI001C9C5FDA|nr:46 kDa FK506-binding nuclear protein-like [Venturia canescens]